MLKKKVIIIFSLLCLFAFCSFPALAYTYNNSQWDAIISQPQISDINSYVEVICADPNTGDISNVFVLFITRLDNDQFPSDMPVVRLTDRGVDITRTNSGARMLGYVSDIRWGSFATMDGNLSSEVWFYPNANLYKPVAVRLHGSLLLYGSSGSSDIIINYGSDTQIAEKLDLIISAVSSVENSSQQIVQADNRNTDKIIDADNNRAEQERKETQTAGQGSVGDVSGAVSADGDGQSLSAAFSLLTDSLSYTGTNSNWALPSLYLPSISGVMDKTVLTDEKSIDFGSYVEMIPTPIMTVIKSLTSIAIVLFAIKEIYGLISYVLTLRGSKNE